MMRISKVLSALISMCFLMGSISGVAYSETGKGENLSRKQNSARFNEIVQRNAVERKNKMLFCGYSHNDIEGMDLPKIQAIDYLQK